MSKYLTFNDVVFKDVALLIAALGELGYTQVEQGESLALYGYLGDERKERAQLVIRRKHIGSASNDLGFMRTAEGYIPIISEYDQTTMRSGKFIPVLRTAYNQRAIEKIAHRLRGTTRQVSNTGGVIKIKVRF